jgi:hypothetical protein
LVLGGAIGGRVATTLLGRVASQAVTGALGAGAASVTGQVLTTGTVDWRRVGSDMLLGGALGAVGGVFGGKTIRRDTRAAVVEEGSVPTMSAGARFEVDSDGVVADRRSPKSTVLSRDDGLWSHVKSLLREERGAVGLPGGGSRLTNSQITDMAARLGFRPTNYKSQSQIVFTNGKVYIVQDITGHVGGLWKMAKTPGALRSKVTRMGTYDYDLNYIAP